MARFILTLGNPVNRIIRPELDRFCRSAGVRPPRRPVPEWLHSPDANLALFPEWFAAPQTDWPLHTRATGFPLEDLRGQFVMPRDIEEFLAPGDKPVLFSPGTGRALLGTRFPEQLPEKLPPWARSFEYLPFSEILPRVGVLVHHGGIGTLSQALAAGVPQLVMPMAHDQPDNAARLKRIGAGGWLAPGKFDAANVALALSRLMTDGGVRSACARAVQLCREDRAAEIAVATLEGAAKNLSD